MIEEKLATLPACRGLAAFVSPEGYRFEPLPTEVEDVAWVGPRPYVRPLVGMLCRLHPFWLLAISQNKARLFHGGPHGLTEEHVPQMPSALADAVDTSSATARSRRTRPSRELR